VRLAACLSVGITVGVVASLMAATASASADREPELRGAPATSPMAALDLDRAPAHVQAVRTPRVSRKGTTSRSDRARAKGDTTRHAAHGGASGHGTDTEGGDGSTTDRDLALAATWQVDPSLLQPQPGDSSSTLDARAKLARVTDHLHAVLGRYHQAQVAAQSAAATATRARAQQKQAEADAATAHRRYKRDRRVLVRMLVTGYEQGPVNSMQYLMTISSLHDLVVGVGTMQQIGSNQTSVVTDAEAAAVRMRQTAAAAVRAAEAARVADQKASDTLEAATATGHQVLDQLDQARDVLTLSVLADQLQSNLAEAMKYARQLKPGSVSFPLPKNSGYYDNHNWGKTSRHWKRLHTGDDYSVACGTPVLAATAGKIEILRDQPWAGPWLVMVSTGPGRLTTWYAHMEALTVKAGQHVKPGQVIGLVGARGNATGCHLHFELHPDGGSIYQDTTDPDPWLRAVGALPGG